MKPAILSAFAAALAAAWPCAAGSLGSVKDDLVVREGDAPKPCPASRLDGKRYYAIYFSAHWCPPCRAFTPELVRFYQETVKAHPDFELVFSSLDRSEQDMTRYMSEATMPWPAVRYAAREKLQKWCGPGIPCLVVLDAAGKVVSDSFQAGQYRGPQAVLDDLRKLLGAGS